jgi:hypothetical protein
MLAVGQLEALKFLAGRGRRCKAKSKGRKNGTFLTFLAPLGTLVPEVIVKLMSRKNLDLNLDPKFAKQSSKYSFCTIHHLLKCIFFLQLV